MSEAKKERQYIPRSRSVKITVSKCKALWRTKESTKIKRCQIKKQKTKKQLFSRQNDQPTRRFLTSNHVIGATFLSGQSWQCSEHNPIKGQMLLTKDSPTQILL